MNSPSADFSAEHIRFLLAREGFSFAEVDRIAGFKKQTADKASYYPHKGGEEAIARILGISAHQIWPSRYDSKTGKRLKPQPLANYSPKPRFRHGKISSSRLTTEAA